MTLPVAETARDVRLVRRLRLASSDAKAPPSAAPDLITDVPASATAVSRSRWESLIGLGCSLMLHLGAFIGMTWIVFEYSEHEAGSLSGVLGEPAQDVGADLIVDSPIVVEAGGKEGPSEFENLIERLSESHVRRAMTNTVSGVGNGAGEGDGEGDGVAVAVPPVAVPSYAVTKGSFSAWTVPEDPEPGQNYVIRILVRLPGEWKPSAKFRLRDITGMVIGTDGYKQAIKFRTTQMAEIQDGAVQIEILVPGARKLVRDTIRIESKLLKEKQVIQLVF